MWYFTQKSNLLHHLQLSHVDLNLYEFHLLNRKYNILKNAGTPKVEKEKYCGNQWVVPTSIQERTQVGFEQVKVNFYSCVKYPFKQFVQFRVRFTNSLHQCKPYFSV